MGSANSCMSSLRMHYTVSSRWAVDITSNNQATSIWQQDVTAGLWSLCNVEGLKGVAGQVVDSSHLTLCATGNLQAFELLRKSQPDSCIMYRNVLEEELRMIASVEDSGVQQKQACC